MARANSDTTAVGDFLRRYFESAEPTHWFVRGQHAGMEGLPAGDEGGELEQELERRRRIIERQGAKPTRNVYGEDLESLVSHPYWEKHSSSYNSYFSPVTLKEIEIEKPNGETYKTVTNRYEACDEIVSLWVDIDALKDELDFLSAQELIVDLKEGPMPPSVVVRSSEQGLQLHWLFKKPVKLTDPKKEKKKWNSLLNKLALRFGADFAVARIGALLRVPGSVNPKHGQSFEVEAQWTDKRYKTKELEDWAGEVDAYTVPYVVLQAVAAVMHGQYESGERHQIALGLAGSLRKAGIPEKAAYRFMEAFGNYFRDEEDRSPNVQSTYEKTDLDDVVGVGGFIENGGRRIQETFEFWADQIKKYSKKEKVEVESPRNDNPVDNTPTVNAEDRMNRRFYIKNGLTYYQPDAEDEHNEPFVYANFAAKIKERVLVEASTGRRSEAIVEIWTPRDEVREIRYDAQAFHSFRDFSTDPSFPTGARPLNPKPALWSLYVDALFESAPPESTGLEYYGVAEIEKVKGLGRRTFYEKLDQIEFLLPHSKSGIYVHVPTNTRDIAVEDAYVRTYTESEAKEYLQRFGDVWSNFQIERFTIPVLGWFGCSMVKNIFMAINGSGFPVLFISGIQGSGKTYPIQALAGHFGLGRDLTSYGSTTHSLKMSMSVSNMTPFLVDEFRTNDPHKTDLTNTLLRSNWTGQKVSSGAGSAGTVRDVPLRTPICILGETVHEDSATLDRTYLIRMNREHVEKVQEMEGAELSRYMENDEWFRSTAHDSMMSSIQFNWIKNNLDVIGDATIAAEEKIPAVQGVTGRKRTGMIAIVTGLYLLKAMWDDFGAEFPFKMKQARKIVTEANLDKTRDSGDNLFMRILLEPTDFLMSELKQGAEDNKPQDWVEADEDAPGDYIHLGIHRWFYDVKNAKPSLTNNPSFSSEENFRNHLIQIASKAPHLGVVEVSKFSAKLSLRAIEDNYNIKTTRWIDWL